MKHTITVGAAAVLLALTLTACKDKNKEGAADSKAAPTTVLAKVNGVSIGSDKQDFLIKEQIPPGTPVDDALRAKIREHLIQRETLLQSARKAGIDKDPAIKARLDYARDEQLVNAYFKDWMAENPVTEEKAKAEFDKRVAAAGDSEYKARHILVEKEEEAKAIIEKLGKNDKFEVLAKTSKDPVSATNGGDLGWARPGTYAPEFAAALTKLEKGKYTTEPVKTQFGYHVILLEDTRKIEGPKFEDVKAQVMQGMQQEAMQAHIKDLVAKAKVE